MNPTVTINEPDKPWEKYRNRERFGTAYWLREIGKHIFDLAGRHADAAAMATYRQLVKELRELPPDEYRLARLAGDAWLEAVERLLVEESGAGRHAIRRAVDSLWRDVAGLIDVLRFVSTLPELGPVAQDAHEWADELQEIVRAQQEHLLYRVAKSPLAKRAG